MADKVNTDTYKELLNALTKNIPLLTDTTLKEILVSVDKLNTKLQKNVDTALNTIIDRIQKWKDAGLSDDIILQNISTEFKEGGLVYDTLLRQTVQDTNLYTTKMEKAIEQDYNKDIEYKKEIWVARLVNTCKDCLKLHGKVATSEYWNSTGRPNERNTICTRYGTCHCVLLPYVDGMETKVKEPITLAKKKIAQIEKERGKKYKRTTKYNLLGSANTDIYDKRLKYYKDRNAKKDKKTDSSKK